MVGLRRTQMGGGLAWLRRTRAQRWRWTQHASGWRGIRTKTRAGGHRFGPVRLRAGRPHSSISGADPATLSLCSPKNMLCQWTEFIGFRFRDTIGRPWVMAIASGASLPAAAGDRWPAPDPSFSYIRPGAPHRMPSPKWKCAQGLVGGGLSAHPFNIWRGGSRRLMAGCGDIVEPERHTSSASTVPCSTRARPWQDVISTLLPPG